jgi:hypothetical protein
MSALLPDARLRSMALRISPSNLQVCAGKIELSAAHDDKICALAFSLRLTV